MTEQMKPSGIVWMGDIPRNWNIKRVKYLASLKGRIGWQGLTSDEYIDEGPYLITGIDFKDGGIDWGNCVHISEKRWAEAPDIHIKNGDLLITKDGTVGKVAVVSGLEGKASLNSGVLLVRTHEDYDKRFLFWVLQSEEFWTWFRLKNAGNSTIIHLYQGDFVEFSYTFPEIGEQQQIAAFLDNQCTKIDGIIADIEKQIEILQKYKKSLITETVTKGLDKSVPMKDSGIEWIGEIPNSWYVKRIKYVIDSIKDGTHGTFDRVDSGEYLLSAKNVFDNGIRIGDNESEISVNDYKSIVANGYPQKSDVLLCCVGTVGRCSVYEFDKPYAFQRSVSFLRPLASTDSFFLQYALQSNSTLIQEQLLINKSAQDGLYMGSVREMVIAIPDTIEEQRTISNFLNTKVKDIDELISNKDQQLEKIQQYKKSLIYEYVTGKKRVTEVN
ncbi:MAG: restriction endonuclease subunit S [Clostridia bacterium]|nr:restriction endonuclease subunit S [Clostridia bacterium]